METVLYNQTDASIYVLRAPVPSVYAGKPGLSLRLSNVYSGAIRVVEVTSYTVQGSYVLLRFKPTSAALPNATGAYDMEVFATADPLRTLYQARIRLQQTIDQAPIL